MARMKQYHLQLKLFIGFLIIQTLSLRLIYSYFSRNNYKISAYIVIPIFIAIVTLFAIKNKWSKKDLGIRFDNLIQGFPLYSLITMIFVLGIFLLKNLLGHSTRPDLSTAWHFKGLFIASSIAQEFLYKSYLMRLEKEIFTNKLVIVLLNGLLFGFMHLMVVAEPAYISFPTTFLLGASLAYAYLKFPNLLLVSASHATLNYLIALFCFFSFQC